MNGRLFPGGDGYLLQKQDVLYRVPYAYQPAEEYLQDQYNKHFAGREQLKIKSYLTITRQVKNGRFYVYDPKIRIPQWAHIIYEYEEGPMFVALL